MIAKSRKKIQNKKQKKINFQIKHVLYQQNAQKINIGDLYCDEDCNKEEFN